MGGNVTLGFLNEVAASILVKEDLSYEFGLKATFCTLYIPRKLIMIQAAL
jgi:hypothetical protein